MTTYNLEDLLNEAIQQLNNMDIGDEFLIRDLYRGIKWRKIPKDLRIQIGKLFFNYAESNKDKIEIMSKTTANHQQYRITKSYI